MISAEHQIHRKPNWRHVGSASAVSGAAEPAQAALTPNRVPGALPYLLPMVTPERIAEGTFAGAFSFHWDPAM